jgi:hypothetical protein
MSQFRALIRQVALLVLSGSLTACATTDSEPPTAHDVFVSILGQQDLTIHAAAAYLRRTSLEVPGLGLTAGIYTPSQLYKMAQACNSRELKDLVQAIESGQVQEYVRRPKLDVLSPIPEQMTSMQKLSGSPEALHPTTDPSQSTVPGSSSEGTCNLQACTVVDDSDCRPDRIKEVPESVAVRDLDYVVVVPRSCCNASSPKDSTPGGDVIAKFGAKEAADRTIELATVTYSDVEVNQLLAIVPLSARGQSDAELGLPEALRKAVLSNFERYQTEIRSSFAAYPPKLLRLTFDRKDVPAVPKANYVAWFQALAASDQGLIYVSPLLARSPFFVCYNQGVPEYVERRYLAIQALRHQDFWRERTPQDLAAVARRLRGSEDEYRQCTESQLFFVLAHEIGHVVESEYLARIVRARDRPNVNPNDPYFAEIDADCFAYVTTARLKAHLDLGVFDKLFLQHPGGEVERLMHARQVHLDALQQYFSTNPLPNTGEGSVELCDQRAATYVAAPH